MIIAKKHLVKERAAAQQQPLPRTAQPHPSTTYSELDDNIHIDSPTSSDEQKAEDGPPPPSHSADSADDFSWLHDYALFLHHVGSTSSEDRKLSDNERLLDVQEGLRAQGATDRYRFYFKQLSEINDSSGEEDDGVEPMGMQSTSTSSSSSSSSSAANTSTSSGLSSLHPSSLLPLPDPVYQQRLRRFHGSHCGYLERRVGVSSWKQRWFVLQGSKLYCYKSHSSNPHTPLSSIAVTDSLVSPLPLYSSLSLSSPASPFVFEISTTQKIFYLRSSSSSDMARWIDALKGSTRVERENEEIDEAQGELDRLAKAEADEDERRRREMLQGVEGVLYDDSGCNWLCKLAMEEKKYRELLAWMDIQVWFFVQRRHRADSGQWATATMREAGAVGGRAGTAGTVGRRRRSSSASMHTPPGSVGSSSTSPARGSLMRRPSINASTLTYIASTTPPTSSSSVLRRRRSSSSASQPGTPSPPSGSSLPPSSFLPSLSTSLIYSRYIEAGSEMEVSLPPSLPGLLRSHILNESSDEEAVMREIEVALRESIGRDLYERWLTDCLGVALMGMPVAGGTFYGHHPWKFVMRMRRKEEREEREREDEERRREEDEERERERRKAEMKLERRRSVGRIKLQQDNDDEKKNGDGIHSRRASLARKVSSRGLILL